MSLAAPLLQGLSSRHSITTDTTALERWFTEHEAALVIQQWYYGWSRCCRRPNSNHDRRYATAERAATAAAVWRLPAGSNTMYTTVRWIQLWMTQRRFYHDHEWLAVLLEALTTLPVAERWALGRAWVGPALCRATTMDPHILARGLHWLDTTTTTTHHHHHGEASSSFQWQNVTMLEGILTVWRQTDHPDALERWIDPLLATTTTTTAEQRNTNTNTTHHAITTATNTARRRRSEPQAAAAAECCGSEEDDDEEDEDDEDDDDEEEHSSKEQQQQRPESSTKSMARELMEDDEDEDDEDDDDDDEEEESDGLFDHEKEDDDDDDDEDEVHSMESVELIPDEAAADAPLSSPEAALPAVRTGNDTTAPPQSTATASTPDDSKDARLAIFIRACTNVLQRHGYSSVLTERLLRALQPPVPPVRTRILLRRAPTQEEFFRGSISRNPIGLHQIASSNTADPTVGDLRQHIANELQMADSAELIEILVAHKIVDVSLPLRVVNQVLWKDHLVQGGSNAVFSAGTISILWTSDRRVTAATPLAALPPMVATYRLTGVDGEATEDTVDQLDDPEGMAGEAGMDGAERARIQAVPPQVALETARQAMAQLVQRVRRDQVDGKFAITDGVPPGLRLLQLCATVHGPALLQAGAPTLLLRWLLDLLKVSRDTNDVASLLQSLIEDLSTLDMATTTHGDGDMAAAQQQLSALLESIQSMDLPKALCGTVAKLLPFLTYGQPALCRELALLMQKHVSVEQWGNDDAPILVQTLVQTLVNLPRDEVICDALRTELVGVGFSHGIAKCILQDLPSTPPPWTKALWSKTDRVVATDPSAPWQAYFARAPALRVALQVLTGLGRAPAELIQPCHWLELTSDSPFCETHGLGLLAETLLDTLLQSDPTTRSLITVARTKSRQRKKEIAQERRTKALANMNLTNVHTKQQQSGLASFLPRRVAGLFQKEAAPSNSPSSTTSTTTTKKRAIPDWMAEADSMKEETGLTCAVCHEGRTIQPNELLGLYAYVKKVSIPLECGGLRQASEGLSLLHSLPSRLPPGYESKGQYASYLMVARSAVVVSLGSSSTPSSSRRTAVYTTTVSAGTGIHFSCHRKARSVDRNHPKAPKSEWEGAALRNNRVNCNVILPLVSQQSSNVPLRAVDAALSDHHSSISNLLGSSPKSTLWTVLHDVRLLMLRMAYAESLSTDCGGGSLTSNCQLIYHQLASMEIFYKDAEVHQPQKALQARAVPDALIVACLSLQENDTEAVTGPEAVSLVPNVAEASTMANLCSIVFDHEQSSPTSPTTKKQKLEHTITSGPKKQWAREQRFFLQALVLLAGRRHGQGVRTSFCNGGGSSFRRSEASTSESNAMRKVGNLELFGSSLRPMLTYFCMAHQLSTDFTNATGIDGGDNGPSPAERLASALETCRRCETVQELLLQPALAGACDGPAELMRLFRQGYDSSGSAVTSI